MAENKTRKGFDLAMFEVPRRMAGIDPHAAHIQTLGAGFRVVKIAGQRLCDAKVYSESRSADLSRRMRESDT